MVASCRSHRPLVCQAASALVDVYRAHLSPNISSFTASASHDGTSCYNSCAWVGQTCDFLNTSLDRDCWKTLEQVFVQWFHPYTPCNVEFMQCSPWESPDMLLRAHVPWVHAVFVQMTEDANNNCRLAVTWLDEVDGYVLLEPHFCPELQTQHLHFGDRSLPSLLGHAISTFCHADRFRLSL